MAFLYLAPALQGVDVRAGAVVQVTGVEARHATVARVRVGERISVSDGDGLLAAGVVTSMEGGVVTVEVEAAERHPAPSPELWLAQALAKGDRDELAVQAATELGVAGVIPWAAERSISRWEGAKAAKGRERWAAIVREASKQSIRARVPVVDAIASTASLAMSPGRVLVLEPTAGARLSDVPLDGDRITLVVGPEGGIAPRELDSFAAAGATLVRLGPEVLRTSTAGPAALAVLNARLGRW